MLRKTLLRLGLAGLMGLLALGGKCKLGLQDTGTGPDTRPIRYRTMEIFYEPPPECVASYNGMPVVGFSVHLYVPNRGYVPQGFCYPNENGRCLISGEAALPLERVGPNRWRGVVENVYVYRDPADPKHRLFACTAADIPGRNVDPLAAYLQAVSIPGAVNTEIVFLGTPSDRGPALLFHLSE